ncbi:metal ABC transporter substrate-binding protein [Ammoniphilus sp. 3BR4]|uniref:metal ABC transporter substrate-binding protein n=1 Tax=Ammoniphilus sp. 3BR4 TaxID=3158265 RepID=UPI003467DD93
MKINKNFSTLLGLSLILSTFLSACSPQSETATAPKQEISASKQNEKLEVYTSFYPLYDFAVKIGGERAHVENLVPPGAEPHDFEPTAKDVIKLNEGDIFIYNGSGFEAWADKVLQSIDNSKMVIVNASEHTALLTREQTGAEEDHHDHGTETEPKEEGHADEEHGHEGEHKEGEHASENSSEGEHKEDEHGLEEEGINDPHIWLDPVRAKDIATAIKDSLIQADPAGKETYEKNYSNLISQLDQLDKEFQSVVQTAQRKEIMVSHAAYGYLVNRYGLKQMAISGLTPSDEPTQKELQEIITFAKENNVKYILFETLVTGKVAEMVRKEIGAEALVFNPLEGLTEEEIAKGKDYFSVMRENLQSLKTALDSK